MHSRLLLALQLTCEFHAILKEDQLRGVTTGLGRAKRTLQGSADGAPTVGNTVDVYSQITRLIIISTQALVYEPSTSCRPNHRKSAEIRSKLYSTGGLTGTLLSQIKMADISTTRHLGPGDVGFISLEHGLTVGEVVVLYVKGGGKKWPTCIEIGSQVQRCRNVMDRLQRVRPCLWTPI
ncbi:hypothetical protein PTI98_011803 [Pleurotus ostreatus]|nr:hypothetical protein PTI98_011803 [Pleurotus ostreatus]